MLFLYKFSVSVPRRLDDRCCVLTLTACYVALLELVNMEVFVTLVRYFYMETILFL